MPSLINIYSEQHRLPPSARKLVDLVGTSGALKLMEVYGGTQKLYIPQQVTGTDFARKLGVKLAQALSAEYGGTYMSNIPRCTSLVIDHRNAEIIRRYESGESPLKLAYEFGITERWARAVIAHQSNPDRQQLLPFPGQPEPAAE